MSFSHVLGQDAAVATLTRALASGRVHHAYRFEGPDGVGKEMAALALAQALVCTAEPPRTGCGVCDACRRATTFAEAKPCVPLHPDVILVERNLYPPEVLGRSRAELSEISVDQIRKVVLTHAAYPPHEGRARVIVVRRAEELSISAANGLLKILEEPKAGTYFVLLTSRPDKLIDTIRSRTLPVRFGPLPTAVIRSVLAARGVPEARAEIAIELAAGSASAALDLADEEATAERDGFVRAALDAIEGRGLAPAIALSESTERDKLKSDLRALSLALARAARADVTGGGDLGKAALAARRYMLVAEATASLDRNASPGLTLIALVAAMKTAVA